MIERLAIVTGGHSGIGLGIATALIEAGWRVALVAHVEPRDGAVRDALGELGEAARYHRFDLRETGGHDALVDRIVSEQGPIAALVSNAGVPSPRRGDLLDVTARDIEAVFAVNLTGGFLLAQAVSRRMLAEDHDAYRAIVFVTSVSAALASPERSEYCMSKAAAAMMARLFALRLAEAGIGVFDLRPGIVATPMTAPVSTRYDDAIAAGLVPARRWGRPADVGAVIVPLLDGSMAYSTGAVIPVDGALSVARL